MVRNSNKNETKFDYKDVSYLKKFVSEKGKITPRRISYISIKRQKDLSNAINSFTSRLFLFFLSFIASLKPSYTSLLIIFLIFFNFT